MNSIFEYFEYRDFLKDHFDYHKKKHAYFSYRYISNKTGLDASFYVKVVQKRLHLSIKSLEPLFEFLKLNQRERDYFILLIHFNKSKQQDRIKFYFEKLISLRGPVTKTLDKQKYEFFNKWYYIAIRELLNYFPEDDHKKIASQLLPNISATEAAKGIDLLKKLSLIEKKVEGGYKLTEGFLSTGDDWRSIAIQNFQTEMMQMGLDSLKRVPKEFRDISTATVNTSWDCFKNITERLKEVRQEIFEMVKNDTNPQAVFQLNFQIFPLTKPPEKGGKK